MFTSKGENRKERNLILFFVVFYTFVRMSISNYLPQVLGELVQKYWHILTQRNVDFKHKKAVLINGENPKI